MHNLRGRDLLSLGDLTPAELAQILEHGARAEARVGTRGAQRAARGQVDRAHLPEAVDAHARLLRGRVRSARRASGRHERRRQRVLARRDACYDTTKVLERYCRRHRDPHVRAVDGRGDRRVRVGSGHQRADRRPPPVPGAGRPAHDRGAPRAPRRACASPTSATATTWPTRTCSAERSPACTSASRRPTGFEPAGLGRRAGALRSPRRPARRSRSRATRSQAVDRRRRRRHRHVGVDGPGGRARRAPRGVRSRYQVDAALMAHADRRRDLHALPAGAPRRRGRRRGHRCPVLGRLRRGREPPARAEGAALARCSASDRPTTDGDRDTHMRKRLERQDAIRRIVRNERVKTQRDARRPAQGARVRLHAGDRLARHHRDGAQEAPRGRLRARRGPAPAAHGLRPRHRREAQRASSCWSRRRRAPLPAWPPRSMLPRSTGSSARSPATTPSSSSPRARRTRRCWSTRSTSSVA